MNESIRTPEDNVVEMVEADSYSDLTEWVQNLAVPGVTNLREASETVRAAKIKYDTREKFRRSGQVVVSGTPRADRFLPEPYRTLDHILSISAYRRFNMGKLPVSRTIYQEDSKARV